MVMMAPQQGQVAPVRDMVPPPMRRSCSRRCAPLPPCCGTSGRTPKTTPVSPGFGSIVRSTRLLSFLHSQRVLSRGTVARHCLQTTVRAHR